MANRSYKNPSKVGRQYTRRNKCPICGLISYKLCDGQACFLCTYAPTYTVGSGYDSDDGISPSEKEKKHEPVITLEGFVPTQAQPGSEEKIQVFIQRVEANMPLFHPEDKTSYVSKSIDLGRVDRD